MENVMMSEAMTSKHLHMVAMQPDAIKIKGGDGLVQTIWETGYYESKIHLNTLNGTLLPPNIMTSQMVNW